MEHTLSVPNPIYHRSGVVPYAYIHYPFENVELFENNNFPGNFVAEGIDQTRGWFYTLMVLSMALFGKPAFRNIICNGHVLAADGRKMSKSLRNYPPPTEILDNYGADALRLYLINSPVVRAEQLHFKGEGVYSVVKNVFLPWYNAYRFLVQNAKRLEAEGYALFVPIDQVTLQRLTNIYVGLNRNRLRGRTGEEDCRQVLSTLYHVLLTTCEVMAPFTPFFTEVLYQNMRKVCNGSEESIHYCSFPQVGGKRDEHIEQSVSRMMTVINLARILRERHNKSLKTPLREMIIVHPDSGFLEYIDGKLRDVLGKRLGKAMGNVAKEVKAMSQTDILTFERVGERPDDTEEKEILDAAGDGDDLVILGFRPDESLSEAGVAREIVSRIQKLRKKAGLEPMDVVEVYFESLRDDQSILHQVLKSQQNYIKEALGSPLLPSVMAPLQNVILCEESFHGISGLAFTIRLARPALTFNLRK
ncbi:hypothetical protein IFM89_037162 [Coptis chinensis]|uniref:Isoleucyl-tRNA synthetase n=1 Tax=Coptis chinensis TaxID=261450 RepID=A0A835I872_9MAGN|nr:hypothetical protein IFM89_037162 [Coptis chinensis]